MKTIIEFSFINCHKEISAFLEEVYKQDRIWQARKHTIPMISIVFVLQRNVSFSHRVYR